MKVMENDTILIDSNNHIHVKAQVITFREGDNYIVFLPSLNLTAASPNSEDEATVNLKNALALFFKMNKKSEEKLRSKMHKLGWQERINGFFMPYVNSKIPTKIISNSPKIKEESLETEFAC